ncbi:hypothetical protein V8G54_004268 [Vigna mungo]|uniref:Uncharacterized protein n=1 Tax=Vigna mungo TaxID=3915 RepID=A0AAQ3PEV2_VIGMU
MVVFDGDDVRLGDENVSFRCDPQRIRRNWQPTASLGVAACGDRFLWTVVVGVLQGENMFTLACREAWEENPTSRSAVVSVVSDCRICLGWPDGTPVGNEILGRWRENPVASGGCFLNGSLPQGLRGLRENPNGF